MSIPVEKSIWPVTDSELEIQQSIEFSGTVLEPTENVTFYLPSYISVLPATSKFIHYLEEKKLRLV